MSVEALALWLSFHIDDTTSHKVTKLRVIILPRFVGKKQKPGEYYNFFEVWIGDHTILISGETTTFSGSGNEARIEFESIFALLSLVYNVPIVRVTSPDNVRIEDLYRREKRSDQ